MRLQAVTQAVVQRALCVPAGGGAGVGEELAQLVEASHGALTAEDEQLQQRLVPCRAASPALATALWHCLKTAQDLKLRSMQL